MAANNNIIPFPSGGAVAGLPAYLAKIPVDVTAFTSGVSPKFSVLSIRGKVWALVKDGTRQLITKPDDPDEPATVVELVLLSANPSLSKVYYEGQFEEGSNAAPDCSSNDGVEPDTGVAEPQAKTCAACPHNVWGSGKGGKGKACADSRRIAVAPAGRLDDPMLLRVPPASLRPLSEYAAEIARHNLPLLAVVTRVRFEAEVATPQLAFKAHGLLPEASFALATETANSDLVRQIVGLEASGPATPRLPVTPAEAEKVAEEIAPKPKAKPVEPTAEESTPVKRAARAKAEAKEAPAPVAEAEDDEAAEIAAAIAAIKAKKAQATPVATAAPDPAPAQNAAGSSLDNEIDALLSEFED
jgi:hypothetical protein